MGKMLEMGSSRKSILEDVFLRSVGVTPADTANIHSFRDLVDILRSDEMDPVDTELSPDRERPEPDMQDMEISPDTDPAMNLENLEVDKEQMEQETDKEPEHDSLQDMDTETEQDVEEEQKDPIETDEEERLEQEIPEFEDFNQEPEQPADAKTLGQKNFRNRKWKWIQKNRLNRIRNQRRKRTITQKMKIF